MDSERSVKRSGACARLIPCGAVLLLFVLLVTPGDAAPGASVVNANTTIAIQQTLTTDLVGLGQGRCNCIHIPDWLFPRSPCRPPWIPKPPVWLPGPPPWVPRPPVWVPKPPVWVPWRPGGGWR